jgi:hypothetical protein
MDAFLRKPFTGEMLAGLFVQLVPPEGALETSIPA